ncbi:hypothetical protein CIPAW_10G072100 [Carya illinoinensis]|uniref:Uncharacterized protein n=1 Tax=Carya illinoinensis TaxID=32201 RepID=A0A8T1PD83_CARIL|nr:hypothetical protein CIPAW_10G072100 [Carya illinoinensis]
MGLGVFFFSFLFYIFLGKTRKSDVMNCLIPLGEPYCLPLKHKMNNKLPKLHYATL